MAGISYFDILSAKSSVLKLMVREREAHFWRFILPRAGNITHKSVI
jgi:hypothetical protein